MANYYTWFSEGLQVDTDEQRAWLEEWLKIPDFAAFSGGGFIVMPFGKEVRWSTPHMLFDKVRAELGWPKRK